MKPTYPDHIKLELERIGKDYPALKGYFSSQTASEGQIVRIGRALLDSKAFNCSDQPGIFPELLSSFISASNPPPDILAEILETLGRMHNFRHPLNYPVFFQWLQDGLAIGTVKHDQIPAFSRQLAIINRTDIDDRPAGYLRKYLDILLALHNKRLAYPGIRGVKTVLFEGKRVFSSEIVADIISYEADRMSADQIAEDLSNLLILIASLKRFGPKAVRTLDVYIRLFLKGSGPRQSLAEVVRIYKTSLLSKINPDKT